MQHLSELNLFKKYFDEKEKKPKQVKKKKEEDVRSDANSQSNESVEGFLRERLEEELEDFAKLILEREFEHTDFENIIFASKNEETEKLKVIPANQIQQSRRFPTGSPNLDKLFEGGIPTKNLIEFYGPPGSGKTQILFQIATVAAKECKILFIDTEGSFNSARIQMMAERFPNWNLNSILENILVLRVTDFKQQIASIEKVVQILEKEKNVGMVIVDSISNLFRARLWGSKLLKLRQQLLNFHLYELKKIGEEYEIAILYSNQVSSISDLDGELETLPVGGNIMGHNSGIRVELNRGRSGYYEAKLISSSYLEPRKVRFSITSQGVL
ncbi:MAG: AAA family ATPase [Methanobacteriota archaeon]|nr:MAG: AAA family ATPase [Euryarchaeota archaeon]